MSNGLARYAEVAVPVCVYATLTYAIPEQLRDHVRLGSRVEVQIGTKSTTGFVVGLLDDTAIDAASIKPLRTVLDEDEPPLIPDIIQLCRWAAEYYIAPLGEMLRVALPANMGSRGRREASLIADEAMIETALASKRILDSDREIVRELRNRPLLVASLLDDMKVTRSAIERLRDAGIIAITDRLQDAKGVRYDRFVVLESSPGALTEKQEAAVALLQARSGEMAVRALDHAGISSAVLSALVKKGVVRVERRPRRHTLDAFLAGLGDAPTGELTYSA